MNNNQNTTADAMNEFQNNVSKTKVHEEHSELINAQNSKVDKAQLSQSIKDKKEAFVKNQIVKK